MLVSALALVTWMPANAIAQQISILNLRKVLGGKQACVAGNRSVQFISEDELLILAGPGPHCYKSVNDLYLIVISTRGQVIARKQWHSTLPAVVLSSKRIVIADSNNIYTLDDHLKTINTISLPPGLGHFNAFLSRKDPDTLLVTYPRETYEYHGTPLDLVGSATSTHRSDVSVIYSSEDGRVVTYHSDTRQLIETGPNGVPRVLADLTWVIGCDKFCQAYDAGFAWSVASQRTKRVLFVSSGSKLPVTDAAGLFPYFHLAVIDLQNGAEIYRKQCLTKTSMRSAQISPDGDFIVMSDGESISIEKLK